MVVGNDPIWSAGEHGPTWALTARLLPMLEASGVALYISGRDPIAQHLRPVPATSSVDFAGIGNGAYYNASMAADPPNIALCPYGSLAWAFGGSTGFLIATVTSPSSTTPALLNVTFFDANGDALYGFSKTNPRASMGYSVYDATNTKALGALPR